MMDMKINLLAEQQQKHRRYLNERDEHWRAKVSLEFSVEVLDCLYHAPYFCFLSTSLRTTDYTDAR